MAVFFAAAVVNLPLRAWVDEGQLTFGWLWLRQHHPAHEVLGAAIGPRIRVGGLGVIVSRWS
jgi:hypothetical protein